MFPDGNDVMDRSQEARKKLDSQLNEHAAIYCIYT